jgi:hypothetical protein
MMEKKSLIFRILYGWRGSFLIAINKKQSSEERRGIFTSPSQPSAEDREAYSGGFQLAIVNPFFRPLTLRQTQAFGHGSGKFRPITAAAVPIHGVPFSALGHLNTEYFFILIP